ncbi:MULTISPECIES: helix-turn-helix domain-containing protein [Streptomyces]|uniref:helix-turn-helix domain-containing protein n=1 Tax=Streptomyces TaxID=1883 RepID=UPI001E44EFC6|nr:MULTISPECIES: helix-turn-helix domain-containing protein [Streptomyces]UFQ16884.1 helix-turn-helix domain-containing protein [Streptomyces huasconensis]WCL86487.1 helix-turn-helix domain-containing protein [Streptomyces sp. JCM 35825]
MTSHTSHSVTAVTVTGGPALPYLYRPAEIAEALGVSEWWVKEQARRKRIPFTRPGGTYRFTAEHFQEIIRLFEERPTRGGREPEVGRQRSRRSEPRTSAESKRARLVPRVPRRMRLAQIAAAA